MPSTEYKIINSFGTPIVYYTEREFEAMKRIFDMHELEYTTEINVLH